MIYCNTFQGSKVMGARQLNILFGQLQTHCSVPSGNWAKNGHYYVKDKSTLLFLFLYKKSIANEKKQTKQNKTLK